MNEEVMNRGLYGLFGYEDYELTFDTSDELIEKLQEVSDPSVWEGKTEVFLKLRSKNEVMNAAKEFMNKRFTLHKIPYKCFLNGLDMKFMTHIKDVSKAAKMCNATNIQVNPFKLPVKFIASSESDTMVITNANFIDNEDFYKNMDVSYKTIILSDKITDCTESSYVHEITHTQLTKTRGIVRNYANSEVLSIFLEFLNIYESGNNDMKLYSTFSRLNELFNYIEIMYSSNEGVEYPQSDLITSIVYSTSILKAFGLLVDYIKGSNVYKKHILNCVQDVFDGNKQLEEVLNILNISTTSTFEDNKLLKYCNSLHK